MLKTLLRGLDARLDRDEELTERNFKKFLRGPQLL
jgi:hypothetical protein